MLLTNEQRGNLLQQFDSRKTNKGSWIVRNNKSKLNIEICNGQATNDITTNTCELCVAANKTAYSGEICTYSHPYCKCLYDDGNVVVQLDFPIAKITGHLFKDVNKTKMMHKIGYRIEDSEELHQILSAIVKRQYQEGEYKYNYLNVNGVHVQINTVIVGKRDHAGELHECHVGCVLWPYGKIKVATPLIVDDID